MSDPMPRSSRVGSRIAIPIFPLSTVVLFPGADCPLHIFEPRYRQMTRAARDDAGLIGMVTVRPEHIGEMAGDPPVYPIGCLGKIVHSEELAEGRINIVLHGAERFRIADEPARPEDRLFREAVVEPLDEPETDSSELQRLRERASGVFGKLLLALAPDRAREIGPETVANHEDNAFVAVLVQVLNLPAIERQTLLETNGVGARLAALESILRFRLAAVGASDGSGRDRLH